MLQKAMTKAKSGMIHKYPSKYSRMEWGAALPEFEMVRDFVKNTPWKNREEKSSIQAFHKMAWHLECPRHAVEPLYTIIKVMKKNKSINKLFGDKALAIMNQRLRGLAGPQDAPCQRCSLPHVLSNVGESCGSTRIS